MWPQDCVNKQKVIPVMQMFLSSQVTLSKVQKILPFFGKTENTAQSFIMGVYEKIFF